MKIRHLVITALFTAAICVMAPFSVPIGPIPITLATLGVYLAAGLLGAKLGTLSVTLYIILGALGVPVFAGFSGGFHKLAGVTGGYIVGYILCALIAGALMRRLRYRPWAIALALVLGTAVLYAFGTAWYILQTGTALMPALAGCVVPFLPCDLIKIAAATGLICILRPVLIRLGLK